MANEDLTGTDKFISSFVITNPDGAADKVPVLDDQIRGIKNVLNNQFPELGANAITANATELNFLDDAIQGDALIPSKGGTGLNFLPHNRLLLGQGTSDVIAVAYGTSGQFLISQGSSLAPIWSNPAISKSWITGYPFGTNDLENNSITDAKLVADSVGNSELKDGCVRQANLYTTTVDLSGSISSGQGVNLTLPAYSFFPMIRAFGAGADQNAIWISPHPTTSTADAPRFRIANETPVTVDYVVRARYVRVS